MSKCAYIESGKRCRRNGTGNPPLCDAHKLVIEDAARSGGTGSRLADLLHRVINGKRVTFTDINAGLDDLAEMFTRKEGDPVRSAAEDFMRQAQAHGRKAWYQPGVFGSTRQPRQAPKPPPRRPPAPDPRLAELREARVVLGFGPNEHLTSDVIKRRQRELARRHHPDHGGRVEVMQRINAAVDVLLETV